MRSIKIEIDPYSGRPSITKEEYYELKESIKESFDPDKVSVLNKSLTKQQAFDILFSDCDYDYFKIYSYLGYLHFFNIIREFVIKKKTFHNWKILQDYKVIKDIKDVRKEKIRKIEDGN